MKPSEALEILVRFKVENEYVEYIAKDYSVSLAAKFAEENQALDYAIELVKRDEGAKPSSLKMQYDYPCYVFHCHCSICNHHLGSWAMNSKPYHDLNFCPECGQRLDWSDEE